LKKITLNDREELRIGIRHWKGRAYADLRVFAGSNPSEAKWPTGKGFLLPAERLQELCQAAAELENAPKGTAVR
jgi:hypothetical protein